MKNKSIRIGLFVLITLIATFLLINFLKGNDFLKGKHTYYTYFEQVEGLNPASAVYIRGFKAGSLKGIDYLREEGRFKVEISIKEDFLIPEDSRAVLFSADILGGRAIRILEGTSPKAAKNGSTLPGEIIPDALGSLMNALPTVAQDASMLMSDLRQTLSHVNRMLGEESQAHLSNILRHLEDTSRQLNSLTAAVDQQQIHQIVTNISQISNRLDSTMITTNRAMQHVEEMAGQLSQAELDQLVGSLKNLSDGLQNPEGSFGKLMHNDSLHHSVVGLVGSLDSLIQKIEENPKKYLKISVF